MDQKGNEEIKSISQLNTDNLVEIVVRSLRLIKQSEDESLIDIPLKLPSNIATKHKICTLVSSKIKDLGYLGECGYNQFLYPVENQTRNLLNWLVQKLPRTEEDSYDEILSSNALLNRRMYFTFKESRDLPWTLPIGLSGGMTFNELVQSLNSSVNLETDSVNRGTRFTLATEFSLDQQNALVKTSIPKLSISSINQDIESTASDQEKHSQIDAEENEKLNEIEILKSEIITGSQYVERFDVEISNITSRIRQIENELLSLSNESEIFEKEILIKKKTLEMLPSAVDNINKLQVICGSSASRLLQLAQEWDTHRRNIIGSLRSQKNIRTKRREKCKQMVDEMKKCKEEMQFMVHELKEKQERSQILSEEMSKLPKNINRAIYTHCILDITASLIKQNKEIERITNDIRDIQKSINQCTSTLQRADAVAEELIFSTAHGSVNDSNMVEAYRQLRSLRFYFEELIEIVSKIGQMEKISRDFETKIDQESARVSVNNIERIQTDLKEVQKENNFIIKEIKSLSA
eukprot:gene20985-27194_t